MPEVEFIYNGSNIIIQCKKNEKMKKIWENFINRIKENKDNIYFSYDGKTGNTFDENITFENMINPEDKKRNKMNIVIFKNEIKEGEKNIVKSKDIVCPICGESIRIDINNYKITLFKCKNKHKIDNVLLDEFEDTQKLDNKKIICGICKKNDKSNTFNNIFYHCCKCKQNLCPICKLKHDKTHKIMNYDDKLYICNKHYENYTSYCEECEINLCTLCESEHKFHKKIYFGDIIQNKDELIKKIKNLENFIYLFNNEVNIIIYILKEVIHKMKLYFKIYENIINNYKIENKNYEILYNLNKIKESNIEKELKNIIYSDIKHKFNDIFDIYKHEFG